MIQCVWVCGAHIQSTTEWASMNRKWAILHYSRLVMSRISSTWHVSFRFCSSFFHIFSSNYFCTKRNQNSICRWKHVRKIVCDWKYERKRINDSFPLNSFSVWNWHFSSASPFKPCCIQCSKSWNATAKYRSYVSRISRIAWRRMQLYFY